MAVQDEGTLLLISLFLQERYALFFLIMITAAAAASAITAAVPAIGAALSPVFTALLPEAVF